jgi:hypothetical protein
MDGHEAGAGNFRRGARERGKTKTVIRRIHHRDAESTEFGKEIIEKILSPCPLCLCGASSESFRKPRKFGRTFVTTKSPERRSRSQYLGRFTAETPRTQSSDKGIV